MHESAPGAGEPMSTGDEGELASSEIGEDELDELGVSWFLAVAVAAGDVAPTPLIMRNMLGVEAEWQSTMQSLTSLYRS